MGVGMAVISGVQAINSYSQGQQQASALASQDEYNKLQAEFNQERMALRKTEIMQKSNVDAELRQRDIADVLGKQNVAIAAGNIELGGDISIAAERDVRQISREDVAAIKNNAWKQAAGIDMSIEDSKLQTSLDSVRSNQKQTDAKTAGVFNALGSAASAYGNYKKYT